MLLITRNSLGRVYRNSFLGTLWSLLQPLSMVLVYTLVMPLIMRLPTPNYPLYIVVTLPVWTFVLASLVGSSQSILTNGDTLKRCMISSTVFPIADVLRNAYTFLISFATMYGVALLFGITPLDWRVMLVPVYFIPVLVTVGALSIAIAFVASYLRDVGDLTSLAMTVIFWLTPIVYPLSLLSPRAQAWEQRNPFFIMLYPIQMLAYEHVTPGSGEVLRLIALALVAVLAGFSVFRLCRHNYVYYL